MRVARHRSRSGERCRMRWPGSLTTLLSLPETWRILTASATRRASLRERCEPPGRPGFRYRVFRLTLTTKAVHDYDERACRERRSRSAAGAVARRGDALGIVDAPAAAARRSVSPAHGRSSGSRLQSAGRTLHPGSTRKGDRRPTRHAERLARSSADSAGLVAGSGGRARVGGMAARRCARTRSHRSEPVLYAARRLAARDGQGYARAVRRRTRGFLSAYASALHPLATPGKRVRGCCRERTAHAPL